MINLGKVKPGSTIYIPFTSFEAATGAPTATTNFAAGDVLVYKDGNTTKRASANGITATTSLDSKVGINLITIDLSDNTTADFWASGSRYVVCVGDITVDTQEVRFVAATFEIGYPGSLLDTTIATLSSQTSFTLTVGSADNNMYNGCPIVIHDAASAIQACVGVVNDYTGASKTIALSAVPKNENKT
jgi:hypothetical protein